MTNRDNNFNFLRVVLASLVIFSHAATLISGDAAKEWVRRLGGAISFGEIAVNGFFMLSGYLITMSWERKPLLWDFLKKRVLRIYPGFIVASLLSICVVGWLGAAEQSQYFSEIRLPKTIFRLLTLDNPFTPPVFPGQPWPQVNGSLWTIQFEFGCYLLVAALGLLGAFRRRSYTLAVFVLLFIAMTITAYLGMDHSAKNLYNWCRLMTMFLSGACVYLFRERIRYTRTGAVIAALVVAVSFVNFTLCHIAMATAGTYLLFATAFAKNETLHRFGRNADVSYGIYLYGWPVQKLLIYYFPMMSVWLHIVLALLFATGLGWLSWIMVESPFLKLKDGKPKNVDKPAPV